MRLNSVVMVSNGPLDEIGGLAKILVVRMSQPMKKRSAMNSIPPKTLGVEER